MILVGIELSSNDRHASPGTRWDWRSSTCRGRLWHNRGDYTRFWRILNDAQIASISWIILDNIDISPEGRIELVKDSKEEISLFRGRHTCQIVYYNRGRESGLEYPLPDFGFFTNRFCEVSVPAKRQLNRIWREAEI